MAKHFDKSHSPVLKRIRSLDAQLPVEHQIYFSRVFDDAEIGPGETRLTPIYLMTERGFLLLAMSLTGAKALAVQLALIDAFNRMADFIRTQCMARL